MAIEGVDYSWDRPNPHTMYSAGKRFACRYFSHDYTGKNLSLAEAKSLAAAGMWIVANWEYGREDPLKGKAQGAADAKLAWSQAAACGKPPGDPIYFSVDFDASAAQMPEIATYLAGCASEIGLYNVGVYGGYAVIDYMYKHKAATYFWQTYAWSGGKVHAANHILQYSNSHALGGGTVDYDRAMQSYYGQWQPNTVATTETAEKPPALPTETGWDYTAQITGTANQFLSLGSSLDSATTAINNLRS